MIMFPEGIWKVICTKGPQGSRGCHFPCCPNHQSSNLYQGLTVCITHHDDRAGIIEYSKGNNAIQVPDLESRVTSGSSRTTGSGTTARSATSGTGRWNYDRVPPPLGIPVILDRFYDRGTAVGEGGCVPGILIR